MEDHLECSTYVPGYSAPIIAIMERRTAETHARFFLPYLKSGFTTPGFHVLDAGCGPGTITLGLARRLGLGHVTGVDVEDSQFAASIEEARQQGLNLTFRKADIYRLPFEDESFDAVFSHAVLQHLADPLAALAELRRVLKPKGLIGIRASDLGGMLIDSEPGGLVEQLTSYFARLREGHGDSCVGRKLPRLLNGLGFNVERVTASYEVVTDLVPKLGPALAAQFPSAFASGNGPRNGDETSFVALAWCEVIGRA